MKKIITILKIMLFATIMFFLSNENIYAQGNGGGGGETAGNNLSFPVIFADGGTKALPGTMESYSLNGEWWYVWGEDPVDPQGTIFSCKPSESNPGKCENGSDPGDGISQVFKAYIQKDINNVWQAYNTSVADGETLIIDWVDWGDNLESLAWGINSKVRTELVLLKDLDEPVTQYAMRHVDGWGTDEVHGLQAQMNNQPVMGEGTQATVYSPKIRFIVQKLNYTRESIPASRLTWDPEMKKWKETLPEYEDIINDPIFNQAAFEAGTGSGYFSAEINVKGKIMYGYTWDVSSINEGEGHYRLTYSFDEGDGVSGRAIFDATTQIVLPIEEEPATMVNTATVLEEPSDGGVAILVPAHNLTYMDILIGEPGEALLNDSDYELSSFTMYPNPSENGIVNIKTTSGNILNVYNVIGNEVFTAKINGSNTVQALDLSGLQPGLYFVRISDNENTSVKKLIIR